METQKMAINYRNSLVGEGGLQKSMEKQMKKQHIMTIKARIKLALNSIPY